MRLRNTAAVPVSAFALGLTLMLASAVPAGAATPVPAKGHATFCLTTAAAKSLADDGVVLTATAPATLDAGEKCVTTPITEGSITVDPLSGDFPLDGGFTFTRTSNQNTLEFTNLNDTLTGTKITADASIVGGAGANIALVTYELTSQHVQVTPQAVDITGPGNIASGSRDAFTAAFDAPPVGLGEALFDISVHLDLPTQ
ncbi:hypothetical protein [Streptomyces sp. NPDC056670]|uniref:hypothetical protein n=1 Tax=Streptomyces sp. NPDC056670 TaxID=3345904 RepID=UPI0036A94BC3